MLIYKKMPALMQEVEAVGKDHKNDHMKYRYRSVDDLMTAVYKVLIKHGVTIVPRYSEPTYTETAKGVRAVFRLDLDWIAEDGSKVTTSTYGEGTDSGDKSAYKCMAGAFKYAMLQTLCIPTDEIKDPEADTSVDRDAPGRGAPQRTRRAKSETLSPLLQISAAKTTSELQAAWAGIRPDLVQLPADSTERAGLVEAYKKKQAELSA